MANKPCYFFGYSWHDGHKAQKGRSSLSALISLRSRNHIIASGQYFAKSVSAKLRVTKTLAIISSPYISNAALISLGMSAL